MLTGNWHCSHPHLVSPLIRQIDSCLSAFNNSNRFHRLIAGIYAIPSSFVFMPWPRMLLQQQSFKSTPLTFKNPRNVRIFTPDTDPLQPVPMLERIPKILFSVAIFSRFDSKFNQAHVYCENKLEHLAVYVFMSSGLRERENTEHFLLKVVRVPPLCILIGLNTENLWNQVWRVVLFSSCVSFHQESGLQLTKPKFRQKALFMIPLCCIIKSFWAPKADAFHAKRP